MNQENWNSDGEKPTVEDLKKYRAARTDLLIEFDGQLIDGRIQDVIAGGRIIRFTNGYHSGWMRCNEFSIIKLLPIPTCCKGFVDRPKRKKRRLTKEQIKRRIQNAFREIKKEKKLDNYVEIKTSKNLR